MDIEARALSYADAQKYIEEASKSDQVKVIQSAFEDRGLLLELESTSAVGLTNVATGERGVRVDILYGVGSKNGEQYRANLQAFFRQEGDQETVAYLRIDNVLLEEYYTDDRIIETSEKYGSVEWLGTALLKQREFEKENWLR